MKVYGPMSVSHKEHMQWLDDAWDEFEKKGASRISDGDEGDEEECPGERGTEEDVDADMADAGSNEYDTDEGNDDTPGKDQHGLQERADDKDMVNNKDDDDRLDSIYVGEELAGHLATKMKQATEDKEVVKNTLVVDESEERGEEFGTVVENGCFLRADDGALRYESKIRLEVGILGQSERRKADVNRIKKAWSTRTRRKRGPTFRATLPEMTQFLSRTSTTPKKGIFSLTIGSRECIVPHVRGSMGELMAGRKFSQTGYVGCVPTSSWVRSGKNCLIFFPRALGAENVSGTLHCVDASTMFFYSPIGTIYVDDRYDHPRNECGF
ncbi:hypothetical protein F4824DRAFT_516912 [Ustulina deusta]|nr:hypothetical protein F4824DRAFT_516912 [Ustulina deusta]